MPRKAENKKVLVDTVPTRPHIPAAYVKLNLRSSDTLSPEQRRSLDDDLQSLADSRREGDEASAFVVLDNGSIHCYTNTI